MAQKIFDDSVTVLKVTMSATRPTDIYVADALDLTGGELSAVFDIRIEDELLRVTAVALDNPSAGTDKWTVSHLGGAPAGGHSAGQEVEVVLTADGIQQFIADDLGATYAPLSGATFTGDIELEAQLVDDTEASGTDGQVFTKVSGHPRWKSVSPVTTDIELDAKLKDHAGSAGTAGQVLTSTGTQIAWATNSGGMADPMTTTGDIIYSSDNSGTPARLGIGSSGQVLKVSAGLPAWAAESGGGTPAPNIYTARMYRNAALSLTGGSAWTKLPFDTVDDDGDADITIASSRYTARVTGQYQANISLDLSALLSAQIKIAVYVNGAIYATLLDMATGAEGIAGSARVKLNAGDYLEVFYNTAGTPALNAGSITRNWVDVTLLPGTGATVLAPQGPVTIGGLAGSADAAPAGPNAADDEFEQNTSGVPAGWTAFGTAPTSQNTSSAKSHYHVIRASSGGTDWSGIYRANPGSSFTMTAKVNWAALDLNNPSVGIFVSDTAAPVKLVLCQLDRNAPGAASVPAHARAIYYSNLTTYGGAISGDQAVTWPVHYVRLVVHSNTNIDAAISEDGITWATIATGFNPGLGALASVGVAIDPEGGAVDAAFDWVRFS